MMTRTKDEWIAAVQHEVDLLEGEGRECAENTALFVAEVMMQPAMVKVLATMTEAQVGGVVGAAMLAYRYGWEYRGEAIPF